jgi:hypothetical protein
MALPHFMKMYQAVRKLLVEDTQRDRQTQTERLVI